MLTTVFQLKKKNHPDHSTLTAHKQTHWPEKHTRKQRILSLSRKLRCTHILICTFPLAINFKTAVI